jgi:hypothetical protein
MEQSSLSKALAALSYLRLNVDERYDSIHTQILVYYAVPTFSQKSLNFFCILNNLLQTLQIVDSGRITGPLSNCIFFLFVALVVQRASKN